MYKYILTSLLLITCISQCYGIQIIHENRSSCKDDSVYQLNLMEERQEMLREQIRIQQEMLDLQRKQARGW